MTLFRGFEGSHGTHGTPVANPDKGGKMEIKSTARTLREPVTRDLWRQHLEGRRPLGIIPIREDNTCLWGCGDVDQYDLSHQELVLRVKKEGLPLVVDKSKSGGAHLYLFLSEPVPAAELQAKLRDLMAGLGFGGCEIFPKQTQVLVERGDQGNWLKMPYFGGDASECYAVAENGRGMTVGQFLRHAEERRISYSAMVKLGVRGTGNGADDVFSDGPPCLQHLSAVGFPQGGRNNGLFALGTFLKRKYPDRWVEMLQEMNDKHMSPPLPAQEVVDVTGALRKKDYNYKCSDQPIASHCNAGLCRTRRFGVGAGGTLPVMASLAKLDTDQPVWFLDVGGERVELTTDQLQQPVRFQHKCMETINVVVPILKRDTWQTILQGLMDNVTIIEAPSEVSLEGQFAELLEVFCTDRQRARERDEILLGKPWWSEEEDRVYFRLRDLQEALERVKFERMTRSQVSNRIRGMGGSSHFFNLKGRGVNVWWVPKGGMVVEKMPHDLPSSREEVI